MALAGQVVTVAHFASLPACRIPEGASTRSNAPTPDRTSPNQCGSQGVNIFGYLRGQFGLGESARMYARSLLEAGYPVALVDIDLDLPHGLDDPSLEAHIGLTAPYAINLIFVNPDYLQRALDEIGNQRLEGRYTIGCWFWELESIPDEWLWALDAVDEILVASTFVEAAIKRVTDKPVTLVPLPIFDVADAGVRRSEFGLPANKYLFLTTFDFHSSIHRKNPYAVVEAFQEAFPADRDDVCLLVKSSNGYQHPERLHQLLSCGVDDPRILVRDQVLGRAHLQALQRCTDAYISLHRAEGFGLGLAECMALGKPVIGTAWSGNTDYMSSENSCLVEYTLVNVLPGEYPHNQGALWAQPDISHAAVFMRELVDDAGFSKELGERACSDVRRELSPALVADKLIARFGVVLGSKGEEN